MNSTGLGLVGRSPGPQPAGSDRGSSSMAQGRRAEHGMSVGLTHCEVAGACRWGSALSPIGTKRRWWRSSRAIGAARKRTNKFGIPSPTGGNANTVCAGHSRCCHLRRPCCGWRTNTSPSGNGRRDTRQEFRRSTTNSIDRRRFFFNSPSRLVHDYDLLRPRASVAGRGLRLMPANKRSEALAGPRSANARLDLRRTQQETV